MIDFADINKSIMAYKLPWTKLERFLRRIKSRLRVNSAKYVARLLSQLAKMAKMAIFKPSLL